MTPDYLNNIQAEPGVSPAISVHFNALEQPSLQQDHSSGVVRGMLSLFKLREANAGDLIVAAGPISTARLDTQE